MTEIFNYMARWGDSLKFTAFGGLVLVVVFPLESYSHLVVIGIVITAILIGSIWRVTEKRKD